MPSERPVCVPAARSRVLAARISAALPRRAAAIPCNAWFFNPVDVVARVRAAVRAASRIGVI